MIRLESLSKSFPGGDLFNNVNILLKRGMRAGLVGPNGSGKSSLLSVLANEINTYDGIVTRLNGRGNYKIIRISIKRS